MAVAGRLAVAEMDRRGKHDQVDDQIEEPGELAEDLEGRLHRRHEDEHHRHGADRERLNQHDSDGHPVLLAAW